MKCKEFQDVVDSYLSDELLTETNHEIMRHMEACVGCRNVIEARHEIRTLLKSAVLASPEYALDENFEHKLVTRLRHEAGNRKITAPFSIFRVRNLAIAASVLLAGLIGYGVFSNFGNDDSPSYLVAGIAEDSLVNVASGDHQHCAIKYDLEEPPIPLPKADPQYRGLDGVIESEVRNRFSDHRLIEAHACKFKNVRFAHFVLVAQDDTISVLVAPTGKHVNDTSPKISGFSSASYQISSFDVEQNTVFVISGEGEEQNRRVAETLAPGLERHFNNQYNAQTAMLTEFVPYLPLAF